MLKIANAYYTCHLPRISELMSEDPVVDEDFSLFLGYSKRIHAFEFAPYSLATNGRVKNIWSVDALRATAQPVAGNP
jgi:hypothetical protein